MKGLLFVLIISAMIGIAQSADFASYKIEISSRVRITDQTSSSSEYEDESYGKVETLDAIIITTRSVYYCGKLIYSSSRITRVALEVTSEFDPSGDEQFSYLEGQGFTIDNYDDEPILPPWA